MALMRPVSASDAIKYYFEEDPMFAKESSVCKGSITKELKFADDVQKTEFEKKLIGNLLFELADIIEWLKEKTIEAKGF